MQSTAPLACVDELAASINNSLNHKQQQQQQQQQPVTDQDSQEAAYDEYYCEEYEELYAPIVKGPKGFGFTIADDSHMNHQKVKQIIDRDRCVNLRENDILLEINGYDLKNLNHNQVVDLLKECLKGQETIIRLKRRKYQIVLPQPPSNSSLNYNVTSASLLEGKGKRIFFSKILFSFKTRKKQKVCFFERLECLCKIKFVFDFVTLQVKFYFVA